MPNRPRDAKIRPRPNAKQPWVDAVEFALLECVRFQKMLIEAIETRTLSSLPKEDIWFELRGPNGKKLIYGREAERRLVYAATDALARSRFSRTTSLDPFVKSLKRRIFEQFIIKGRVVDLSSVDSVFGKALTEAGTDCADSRHFIPCQLMFVADPDHFAIGPVTFHNRTAFGSLASDLTSAWREQENADSGPSLVDQVMAYYQSFTWVADVTIRGCDEAVGKERADQAVRAALDFLHLMFGHYHSRKMVVGGPGLTSDVRAGFEVRGGSTLLNYSVGSTSAVGFEEGWSRMLADPEALILVAAAARALEAITDPVTDRPLGLRFINAASWHGQAVREADPAASIVKSVTALEHLVTTGKVEDTTKIVSERCAALKFDVSDDLGFEEVVERMRDIYDLRSRLVHGTLSPFDTEVRERRAEVLASTEAILANGLALLDRDGLFDQRVTGRQLSEGMDRLVAWARRIGSSLEPQAQPFT